MLGILIVSIVLPCLARSSFIDLGYGYDENTLVYPGLQKFRFTKENAGEVKGTFIASNNFEMGEHCGTHIDAPYHFNRNGKKVGEIPVDKLIAKGIYINVRDEASNDPNYRLPVSKLIQWVEANGPILNNTVVFVDFGWARRYPNFSLYFGPSPQNLSFPGLSDEAFDWMVDSKKIVGVGVDTPSPDGGGEWRVYGHVKLTSNDMYILENVNLNQNGIPARFDLLVMPIKLMKGSGGPCRIIAIVNE